MNPLSITIVALFLLCQQELLTSAAKERPGSCPMFPMVVRECPGNPQDTCSSDQDCERGYKCCWTPCLKTCLNVSGTIGNYKPKPKPPTAGVCSLPKVVGRCRAAFRRWYFNQKTKRCQRFIYGGCGGNKNNFRTLKDCRATCPGY